MSEFNATAEVSKQIAVSLLAAQDHGLPVWASFYVDPKQDGIDVTLFNDEGGVIHEGTYKVVPA